MLPWFYPIPEPGTPEELKAALMQLPGPIPVEGRIYAFEYDPVKEKISSGRSMWQVIGVDARGVAISVYLSGYHVISWKTWEYACHEHLIKIAVIDWRTEAINALMLRMGVGVILHSAPSDTEFWE